MIKVIMAQHQMFGHVGLFFMCSWPVSYHLMKQTSYSYIRRYITFDDDHNS